MVNETGIISKEEAKEVLVHYIKSARDLKQLVEQHDKGREYKGQRWTEINEKYSILTKDIKRHYEYLQSGETFGTEAAFFETAIKDIYVSTMVLKVDMEADDFLYKLSLLLIEIEGYAKFWLPQSIRT